MSGHVLGHIVKTQEVVVRVIPDAIPEANLSIHIPVISTAGSRRILAREQARVNAAGYTDPRSSTIHRGGVHAAVIASLVVNSKMQGGRALRRGNVCGDEGGKGPQVVVNNREGNGADQQARTLNNLYNHAHVNL